ncbi:hypothetical protein DdX_06048 [Ditylenchus destructor]|uniref:Uncharacterized protein n=1 Tax=Ditylenchus destructor TaxID=166010 RepID=A0AAD4N6W1_9BILA|nr:hypothetical protein DdX_06048 [Ditylenchus destructor]
MHTYRGGNILGVWTELRAGDPIRTRNIKGMHLRMEETRDMCPLADFIRRLSIHDLLILRREKGNWFLRIISFSSLLKEVQL